MNKSLEKILLVFIALCLVLVSYFAGKKSTEDLIREKDELLIEFTDQQERLQMLNQSTIENMVVEDGVIYVIGHKSPDTDTVISAIAYARILNMLGHEAEAVITAEPNKETQYILKEAGVETPRILYDASGENIFLVDHSEYAQAVDGLVDAHVVGVLDHHGVGTLNTGNQVVYEARPMGATAAIVWMDYLNYGLEIDQTTAYLLLCAVLSDTDNLTASTTSLADREAVTALAEIAGVSEVDALFARLHEEKLSYEGMSGLDILFSDYKEYEASGVRFGIGAVNAIDEESAARLAEMMKEALAEGFKTRDVDLMYASVGIRENGKKTDYIVPCEGLSETVFKAAFPNYDEYDGTSYIFRTGLGRKSLFVPGLTDYLGAHPHE